PPTEAARRARWKAHLAVAPARLAPGLALAPAVASCRLRILCARHLSGQIRSHLIPRAPPAASASAIRPVRCTAQHRASQLAGERALETCGRVREEARPGRRCRAIRRYLFSLRLGRFISLVTTSVFALLESDP